MSIKLLVSVRDADEAIVASQAGVDIIDVKDPSQGPLGFAGEKTIRSVIAAVGTVSHVSAALGECTDWSSHVASSVADSAKPALRYVKLGLAGMKPVAPVAAASEGPRSSQNTVGDSWVDRWTCVRSSCLSGLPVNAQTAWVAVAYADAERANAPSVSEVLAAATATNCAVFLIDTFVKDGQTTVDWMAEEELTSLRQLANSNGMKFALAGQLTSAHLPSISRIRPDIFAVRGAVCEESERRRSISGARIRTLQTELALL